MIELLDKWNRFGNAKVFRQIQHAVQADAKRVVGTVKSLLTYEKYGAQLNRNPLADENI
jgi:hypothetical protein